ncbi:MAG: LuxR C-terminal-related transcriptional regulator [Pseudomonadota bacterium]
MIEHDPPSSGTGREEVLDRIYQVALEPSALDDLISLWCDEGLPELLADRPRGDAGSAEAPGVYHRHIARAQAILGQGRTEHPSLADHLKGFDNLAAFVIGGALTVAAANAGARAAFGAQEGQPIGGLGLPDEVGAALHATVQGVLHGAPGAERLVKVDASDKGGTMLLRVLRVAGAPEGGPAALVVSTAFRLRRTVATLLDQVFGLTEAERDVVRLLVGGDDIKTIARTRGTREGTTRGQVKSIIAKMNLRSQTDIVRMAMALGAFPDVAPGEEEALRAPELSQRWLDAEVWKPLDRLALPDGRSMGYLDTGPASGAPVLMSHMGSCMVRWSHSMIRMAFEQDLRVIVPVRAGYGPSAALPPRTDPLAAASDDAMRLLAHLGIGPLPYLAQGTDFAFAADMIARHPGAVTALIGSGARPCLPGGEQVGGPGRWQKFFVAAARTAPHLAEFASIAVMEMSRRIGPEAMLRSLCKDSAADLALLEIGEMRQVLAANIALMSQSAGRAGQAFAREYVAFQGDWSASVRATRAIPVQLFIAEEDPTIHTEAVGDLRHAYPWMEIETVPNAGLALTYQFHRTLIPLLAKAARSAARRPG